MPWPTSIPPDLRRSLDRALSMRNVSAADLWTEVRDWLVVRGVEAPKLPDEPRPGILSASMKDQ